MDTAERRKRASGEAAEWWVHMQSEVSRGLREQYVDWLRESSLHVAEMLRVAQIHGGLQHFERWNQITFNSAELHDETVVSLPAPCRSEPGTQEPESPRWLRPVWSVATALVTAIVLTTVVLFTLRDQVIQTDRAERREIALADGSVVQLDPETRLRISYATRARRVSLEYGRALFHVAKDPNRPFFVDAGDATVRAVGTAFAIERQIESVLVTVAEGKVAVLPAQPASEAIAGWPLPATAAATQKQTLSSYQGSEALRVGHPETAEWPRGSFPEIFLAANQQVAVARSGNAEPVHTVDSSRVLAWADGRLIFDNSTVGDAIRQFNRYNRIQIHVNDAELARRPISGVFSEADPESFVLFIESIAAARVTRTSSTDIAIDPSE
jgi:transmembrane sensor